MSESPRELLQKHRLKPKHSWGQNFLGDPQVLARIAAAAQLKEGEPVVELGAGLGHLTRALLATGARVTAVERDRELVAVLEGLALPGVRIVAANATDIDFAETAAAPEVTVVGNLPYHLTSPILFAVLDQRARISRAVFTVQLEVAERLVAAPGSRDYGLLSVLLGMFFERVLVAELPRALFHPPPNVDSAVVRLWRRAQPAAPLTSEERFRRVVKAGFGQRRKTLLNALKADKTLGSPEQLRTALEAAGVDPMRRAETLTPEEFAAIERALPVPAP